MVKLRRFSADKLFEQLKNALLKESICWTAAQGNNINNNNSANTNNGSGTSELVKSAERDETCEYVLEVCERADMSLSVDTFALCVCLLDRFLASYKVKSKYLECLAVACLYIACKIKEEDEKVSITSEFLIECDCKCSIAELLRMELMILGKFEWSVNDVTAVDFLHIYYALFVDSVSVNQSSDDDAWKFSVPESLDFMATLEARLKHCLCANELATMYKPHVLAYALLEMQVKAAAVAHHLPDTVSERMRALKQACKLDDASLAECIDACHVRLTTLDDASKRMIIDNEYYIDEYYIDMSRDILRMYRAMSAARAAHYYSYLSNINTNLTAIKEEDEYEETTEEKSAVAATTATKLGGVLGNISTNMIAENETTKATPSSARCSFTYADILLGRHDNSNNTEKRKLPESSSGEEEDEEEEEEDIENRLILSN